MDIHADLSCLHYLRIRTECTNSGDWSDYTSVTCDQWNTFQIILKKKSNKNAAYKIHLSHVIASMAKKKWETPKRNAAKSYIMCTFQDVKPTQETAGSGLNRLYNVLCLLWNIFHNQQKHWITYTYQLLIISHVCCHLVRVNGMCWVVIYKMYLPWYPPYVKAYDNI